MLSPRDEGPARLAVSLQHTHHVRLNLEARCKSAVVNVVKTKEISTPVLSRMDSVLPVKQNGGDVTLLAPLVDCIYRVSQKSHQGHIGFLTSGENGEKMKSFILILIY